jgi:flagellar FliL protein
MSDEGAGTTKLEESGKGGNNKLVMIIIAANLVITLGMIGVLVMSFQKDRKEAQAVDMVASEEHGGGGEHGEGGGGGEHGGGSEHGGGDKSSEKKGSSNYGKMIQLEQFTVNLSTPGTVNPKFVRVNISVEVPTSETENEVQQKMPQVRNTIIDLFNSKRPTDLVTAEGRDYLKEEIRNAMNSFMVSGRVKSVFFTNFAVSN